MTKREQGSPGRPPVGVEAMTEAERAARYRTARRKAAEAAVRWSDSRMVAALSDAAILDALRLAVGAADGNGVWALTGVIRERHPPKVTRHRKQERPAPKQKKARPHAEDWMLTEAAAGALGLEVDDPANEKKLARLVELIRPHVDRLAAAAGETYGPTWARAVLKGEAALRSQPGARAAFKSLAARWMSEMCKLPAC